MARNFKVGDRVKVPLNRYGDLALFCLPVRYLTATVSEASSTRFTVDWFIFDQPSVGGVLCKKLKRLKKKPTLKPLAESYSFILRTEDAVKHVPALRFIEYDHKSVEFSIDCYTGDWHSDIDYGNIFSDSDVSKQLRKLLELLGVKVEEA